MNAFEIGDLVTFTGGFSEGDTGTITGHGAALNSTPMLWVRPAGWNTSHLYSPQILAPTSIDEAAWIRDNAWTPAMRKTHTEVPGFRTTCACQHGQTQWCQMGKHDRCHRATPQYGYATVICGRGGESPVHFAEMFEHKTPSITGPRREQVAMVWLADRTCRWVCPCDCHAPPAAPEQLDLFAGVA